MYKYPYKGKPGNNNFDHWLSQMFWIQAKVISLLIPLKSGTTENA